MAPSAAAEKTPPWRAMAAAAIAIAIIAVYANSLEVPFQFDDKAAILHNASIRHLGDLGQVLSPPHGTGTTVDGRPMLNFSLALNYAFGGTNARGYHALNIAIQALAALTLFGIVRRTLLLLRRPGAPDERRFGTSEATALGFAVALIWALHPLQTESVTYVIQRAESMMGLFYLLTLYGFIRYTESDGSAWAGLCIFSCLLGMATKEVMVSAPLIVLLYDATFVSRGILPALRARVRFYCYLAATGLVPIALALTTGNRGGTAGFGIDVGPFKYWETQFQAVAHYLWLSFWPRTLIFDYGVEWVNDPADVIPYALLVIALAVASAIALFKRRAPGFLGAFFFAILAPTSIVPGNRQTLAEHRMYLPLAAVIALVVCGAWGLIPPARRRSWAAPAFLLLLAAASTLAGATVIRNRDYRDEMTLYRDTVAKRPGNASAHDNLGNLLRDNQRYDEAILHYEEALRLRPDYYQAHYNCGIALADSGRLQQAIAQYEAAIRLKPDYFEAHNNLGIALSRSGRDSEAIVQLSEAARLKPSYLDAHYNLGLVLARTGRLQEALAELDQTVRLNPAFYPARMTLGYALQALGRNQEAAAQFDVASRLKASAR